MYIYNAQIRRGSKHILDMLAKYRSKLNVSFVFYATQNSPLVIDEILYTLKIVIFYT